MPEEQKRYWQSLEAWQRDPRTRALSQREFPAELPVGETTAGALYPDRRTFLQTLGFTLAAAGLAGCERPVQKVIPFLNRPPEMVPGHAAWYATTCTGCAARCGVLARVREGRVIKVEGNPEHALSRGGLCALGQAEVLGLYDSGRLRGPSRNGTPVTWETADAAVRAGLEQARQAGAEIVLVTPPPSGPVERAAAADFLAAWRGARHVVWSPVERSGEAEAHRRLFGEAFLPALRFDAARLLVALESDLLVDGPAPVPTIKQYAAARRADRRERMLRHVQFESRMSLTGSNADERIVLPPGLRAPALAAIAGRLARHANRTDLPESASESLPEELLGRLEETADALWAARGHSVLRCGIEDVDLQLLTAGCNALLGAYGTILDTERRTETGWTGTGHGAAGMDALLADLRGGRVGALVLAGCNPVYARPDGTAWEDALAGAPFFAAISDRPDETARLADVIAPPPHPLESWGDAEPESGRFSLLQPAMAPLWETRETFASLTAWAGRPSAALEYLRGVWRTHVFGHRTDGGDFTSFWDSALQSGFVETALPPRPRLRTDPDPDVFAGALVAVRDRTPAAAAEAAAPVLLLYEKVALRDGSRANNPYLQELPDPVTKGTWTNYASLAPDTAVERALADGDLVRIRASEADEGILLPVLVQPGQAPGTVAVALGYGRTHAGPAGDGRGANAWRLLRAAGRPIALEPVGGRRPIAKGQIHQSMEGRPLVLETSLAAFLAGDERGEPAGGGGGHESHHREEGHPESIWPEFTYAGHYWAMAIDLNACIGCSGCVVGCDLENNVPVVGEEEVGRYRDMHWLRIDRYYAGDPAAPEVVHQPMLCQHCDHAPCENVCPVLATVHNAEGLNEQVYNRCVGTRYCANNCPIKTRRFNWFDYPHDDRVRDLLLNPDVTVRTRGVMEKCSMCIQRVQAAKITARNEGRPVAHGEVQTACRQSCPADAIVFGDLNDPDSAIHRVFRSGRSYELLGELHLDAGVRYLSKIRNKALRGGEEAPRGA